MLDSEDEVKRGQLSSELGAAVGLPATLFERIYDHDTIGVFVALYDTSVLFPVGGKVVSNSSSKQRIVGSQILAAIVARHWY